MVKVTLDTNCVVNIFDSYSETATSVESIAELFNLGLQGQADLAVTTRLGADIGRDRDEKRGAELMRRAAMLPVVGSIVRLDVTRLDSGDVLAGDDHAMLEKGVREMLSPRLENTDAHYSNKINDIDHLVGHKINERDVFVTDDGKILKKSDGLREQCGILVMSPVDAVAYVRRMAEGNFYGSLVRGLGSQIYWVSRIDGGRYVFPNEETFRSWYPVVRSQPEILYVPDAVLRNIPLKGNEVYRPGSRLIRTKYDTKTHAVSKGGVIRWLASEAACDAIFGKAWRNLVDVLPDELMCNYIIGSDIIVPGDYDPIAEFDSVTDPDGNRRCRQ